MSLETQHKAADIIQQAAQEGSLAIYIESLPGGEMRVIFPDFRYADYAELLYACADLIADQAACPGKTIRLRD